MGHGRAVGAQAGSVTVKLVNESDTPHAVEVEGNGVEEETETVTGGETELTVDLEAGEVQYYCPVGEHRQTAWRARSPSNSGQRTPICSDSSRGAAAFSTAARSPALIPNRTITRGCGSVPSTIIARCAPSGQLRPGAIKAQVNCV